MGRKITALLVLTIAIAFFLRFYKVTEIPPSLNWDEVSINYNAYSLIKTGRDEWSAFWPVHFKAYGEYKLPAQIYASIPGILFFGLNELGVRITPVIYGTLTVLLVYFLTRLLFKNDLIGILSAFLLAISPWHIHLTRASFESSFSVFWIILGLFLFVKGFEKRKWFVLSVIPFVLSMYTYNSARVFTPLFLIALLIIFRKFFWKIKKILALSITLFIVLLLPIVPYYLQGEGNSRYRLVSITDDPGLVMRINENRRISTLTDPLVRLVHNKFTYISYYVSRNYLAHFTPDFLFISGAPHKQHHVQNIGQLYLFQAPFILLGLYFLYKLRQQFRWVLISGLLLATVPVSVTNDSIPHALRTLIANPFYQIITALGMYQAYSFLKKRIYRFRQYLIGSFALAVLVSITAYLYNYYMVYSELYSRDWQYGYKQVVQYIKDHQSEYDEIVFTRHFGEPHMFTLFFLQYEPEQFQKDPNLIRFETYDWVRVLKFDKFYFPDLGDQGTGFEDIVAQNQNKKLLFIGKAGDFPPEVPTLKQVYFLNGDRAFEIVESR